ncbi:MAG: FAD-dependent oxidoreductase, partial [Planctomycetota bacterium]
MQPDVLVIGAGPAGSTLAWRLARAGFAVTIADRAVFPRDKPCGEFLSPECAPCLAELGLHDLPGQLGAVPVPGMRLSGFGCTAHGRFRQLPDRAGHGRCGFGLRRVVLDDALL